jgi:hypothetical protein
MTSLHQVIDFSKFAINLSAITGTMVTVENLNLGLNGAVMPQAKSAHTHTGRQVPSNDGGTAGVLSTLTSRGDEPSAVAEETSPSVARHDAVQHSPRRSPRLTSPFVRTGGAISLSRAAQLNDPALNGAIVTLNAPTSPDPKMVDASLSTDSSVSTDSGSKRKQQELLQAVCNHDDASSYIAEVGKSYFNHDYLLKTDYAPRECALCLVYFGGSDYRVGTKTPAMLCSNAKMKTHTCMYALCTPCFKTWSIHSNDDDGPPTTRNRRTTVSRTVVH